MKRTCVFLPKEIIAQLAKESRRSGTKVSEIIRCALRDYFEKREGRKWK